MTKERIITFKIIKINVPQKRLRKLFYAERYLESQEKVKISQKLREIEDAIIKLEHLRSIVGRILLKG